jgi:hypothetical protein
MAYTKRTNNFKAYVQISLLPDMVEEVHQLVLKPDSLLEAVGELILAGFVLKISYETATETCQVAAIQSAENHKDEGYGYYSSGETPDQAIAACYAKWRFLVRQKMQLSEVGEKARPKLS